jgi:hypothetical protein
MGKAAEKQKARENGLFEGNIHIPGAKISVPQIGKYKSL